MSNTELDLSESAVDSEPLSHEENEGRPTRSPSPPALVYSPPRKSSVPQPPPCSYPEIPPRNATLYIHGDEYINEPNYHSLWWFAFCAVCLTFPLGWCPCYFYHKSKMYLEGENKNRKMAFKFARRAKISGIILIVIGLMWQITYILILLGKVDDILLELKEDGKNKKNAITVFSEAGTTASTVYSTAGTNASTVYGIAGTNASTVYNIAGTNESTV